MPDRTRWIVEPEPEEKVQLSLAFTKMPEQAPAEKQDMVITNPLDALVVAQKLLEAWYRHPTYRLRIRGRFETAATDPEIPMNKFDALIAEISNGGDDEEVDAQPLIDRLTEIWCELLPFRKASLKGDPHLHRAIKMIQVSVEMIKHLAAGTEMPRSRGI